MTNTIKIGVMPGRITEYAVTEGTTVSDALQMAGLSSTGYEIKLDGRTVSEADVASGNILLLTKKVKGNAGTIKIGVMPGRITEYALAEGTTVADALQMAGLSASGYEIKLDGRTVTETETAAGNILLLTKKVKGNSTIKIGVMPGRITEYAVNPGTTVSDALQMAGLSSSGYEIKLDGRTVTESDVASGNILLLTKKVKGNTSTIKIGVMPGRITEYAVTPGTTVASALEMAGLSASGYEIKLDGRTVTESDVASGNILLLTKKVKGNNGGNNVETRTDGEDTTITSR